MVSKIELDRYADTGFAVADTPAELNALLFRRMMAKTGAERLAIGCQMADSARQLVWSGIPTDLSPSERRDCFLERFYGPTLTHFFGTAPQSRRDAGK
jgi:hypothetical protein